MGVFANALNSAVGQARPASLEPSSRHLGLAAWLLSLFHRRAFHQPRLALVERIALAPRQTLALIEADGQRLLVATSPDGAPAFFPLPPKTKPISSKKAASKGKGL